MNIVSIMSAAAIVAGLGIVAFLLCKICRCTSRDENYDSRKGGHGNSDNIPTLDTMIVTLEKKALAYAVYREALKCGVKQTSKDILYAKFGCVSLPPSLEEDEAFRIHPLLMSDRNFLAALNRWLVTRGGHEYPDFFSAATEAGKILVESKRDEACQIVSCVN